MRSVGSHELSVLGSRVPGLAQPAGLDTAEPCVSMPCACVLQLPLDSSLLLQTQFPKVATLDLSQVTHISWVALTAYLIWAAFQSLGQKRIAQLPQGKILVITQKSSNKEVTSLP